MKRSNGNGNVMQPTTINLTLRVNILAYILDWYLSLSVVLGLMKNSNDWTVRQTMIKKTDN